MACVCAAAPALTIPGAAGEHNSVLDLPARCVHLCMTLPAHPRISNAARRLPAYQLPGGTLFVPPGATPALVAPPGAHVAQPSTTFVAADPADADYRLHAGPDAFMLVTGEALQAAAVDEAGDAVPITAQLPTVAELVGESRLSALHAGPPAAAAGPSMWASTSAAAAATSAFAQPGSAGGMSSGTLTIAAAVAAATSWQQPDGRCE